MMYYGGAGWLGWIVMGFSMIAVTALVIGLVLWTVRSGSHAKAPVSRALGILQERLAKGEISTEEYRQQSLLITGAA